LEYFKVGDGAYYESWIIIPQIVKL